MQSGVLSCLLEMLSVCVGFCLCPSCGYPPSSRAAVVYSTRAALRICARVRGWGGQMSKMQSAVQTVASSPQQFVVMTFMMDESTFKLQPKGETPQVPRLGVCFLFFLAVRLNLDRGASASRLRSGPRGRSRLLA